MSRILTRLPRTIPPTAPLQLTLSSSRITTTRGIVTDLETGGTRKAKQSAGKGFIFVSGGQQDRGMPTSDKGDEPMPPKYSTSTGHTILPSLKQSVQQTMEHPEEWEGIHAEYVASMGETNTNSANTEKWEGLRAEANASDGWEAGRAGMDTERDMTEAWRSEMSSESTGGAGRSRTKGRNKGATSSTEKAAEGAGKKHAKKEASTSSSSSSKKKPQSKDSKRSGARGKESAAESNSPDYASPMDAHHSQTLPHSTMDTATGQQPIPPSSNDFSSSSSAAAGAGANTIEEDSIPHLPLTPKLSLGAASLPSGFTLEPQPRPAPTAIKPFATASTAWISWAFIQSPGNNVGVSRFARSHSTTSPNITKATGLSGAAEQKQQQQQQPKPKHKKKTQAQMDEELRMRMEDRMAGEGGAAGVEYEDGKPVAMKRGVRENMFRYI